MQQAEFRLFFDGDAASRQQLDRIESIEVEQEMEKAWEAAITIPVCLDDNGNWSGDDERFMEAFSCIRIELKPRDGQFQPLIDGPIIGYDTNRSSEPGQSHIKLLVHDDSVHLNRNADVETLEGPDSDIARRIFGEYSEVISSTRIDATPSSSERDGAEAVRRGTHMELLRILAQRNDKVACVLPGNRPGESIGCFLETPFEAGGDLPQLVLHGPEANIVTFNAQLDAQRPSTVSASELSIDDKTVTTRQSRYRDVELVGEAPPIEEEDQLGTDLLRPGTSGGADLDQRVRAETRRLSRAYDASGSVRGGCYRGVLTPYRRIVVCLGRTSTSSAYIVHKVTHKIDRSSYRQEFGLTSDSQSSTTASPQVPGGIF